MPPPAPPPWDGDEDLLDDELLDEQEEEWVEVGEDGAPGFRGALFSSQAAHYAAYRPLYPLHIYQRIYDFAAVALGRQPGHSSQELAIDVGCGPGNVAVELAKRYAQVIGIDSSQAQLDHAFKRPNIRYIHTAAEYLGSILPPQSVDLVAIAETLHWIDHRKFYEQVRQILKPTGVLAIWCYDLCEFRAMGEHQTAAGLAQANGLMRAFTYGTMGPFWDDRRQYIDKKYVGLEPTQGQFKVIERDDMEMEHIMSMDRYIGFLSSWSPYAAYRATFPRKEDPLIELRAQFKQLLAVTDDAAPSLRVVWPVFFLLARQPVPW
ncbi:hypothetical protein ABPG77_010466 [Micractinium sp. CCAP 211/92]